MPQKLIFAHTFEGLLRSLRSQLTPELIAGMRARGLDPERPLRDAYPMETFVEVVHFVAGRLHPQLELEAAVARVGRDFMDGFGQTMIGRAMLAMMRVIGPQSALRRVTQEFRTGNNYSETRLTQRGPSEFELWVNELQMPGWYVGIVGRGLELAGARSTSVTLLRKEEVGGTFRVAWE
jgi:uncharacterized protein (TIGR02265 family)